MERMNRPYTALLVIALLMSAGLDSPLAVAPAPPVSIRLPDIGDPSQLIYSPTDDQRLGKQFMRSLHKSVKFSEHPQVQAYVEDLGQRLVAATGDGTRPFSFFVISDPSVNAFAGPGGNIGLHSGLILTSRTESELASVVAHEIAHVTQNHLARRFEVAEKMSLPAAAALLAAIVVGAATSPSAGAAAAATIQAGLVQRQIDFTRANEQEADRLGFELLANAGFEAAAMPVFLGRLQRANQIRDVKLPEYLRTHPITSNRIADIEARISDLPKQWIAPSERFHLVRERLRNEASVDPHEDIREYRDVLRSGRTASETASRFGLALALLRAGELSAARKQATALRRQAPEQIAFAVLEAEVLSADGQYARAAASLKELAQLHPDNVEVALPRARALLISGQPKAARGALETLISRGRTDLGTFRLLAQAEAEAGNPALSHWYEAGIQYALGNTESAVRQLEIASRERGLDFPVRQQIEARLKAYKEVLEAERKDKGHGGA